MQAKPWLGSLAVSHTSACVKYVEENVRDTHRIACICVPKHEYYTKIKTQRRHYNLDKETRVSSRRYLRDSGGGDGGGNGPHP